jgi:uncharacterized membrane protein
MLTTRNAAIAAAALVAAALLAGLWAWPMLPSEMAVHWNAAGEADGAAGKAIGVLFLPLVAAAMAALLFALPRIDPLAKGYRAFRKEYDGLILVLVGFMGGIQGAVLAWNLGYRFDLIRFVGPGVGLLFFCLGAVMPQFKRNWFAGIRTPWTLSSDRVWDETHRHGGFLFRAAGVLACLGAVVPDYGIALVFVPIVAASLWTLIYSYLVYRKGS